MNRNQHSVPHSVKRWQLNGTDYKPQQVRNLRTETRFSSWTPLNHQHSNIQDCLWAGRCIRRGWFLPYTPVDKEFGAWKNHYVSCVSTLGLLSPRQAAEMYGTLNQQNLGREEEEERRKERIIREMIREKLQEEKSEWKDTRFPTCGLPLNPFLHTFTSSDSVTRSSTSRPALNPSHAPLLLLISNRTPAYELLLSGVTSGVMVVLYDHRGTLPALLAQVERAVCGRPAQRLGLLAPGGTEEISLNYLICARTLLNPDQREFWEKLCGWVAPTSEGGGMDIFCPLAASGSITLTRLSEYVSSVPSAHCLLVSCSIRRDSDPTSVHSDWSGGSTPALQYVNDGVLQFWCRQAQWMEEVLVELRGFMGPRIQQISLQTRGRALGGFKDREPTAGLNISYYVLLFSKVLKAAGDNATEADTWYCKTRLADKCPSVLQVYQDPLTAALNSNRAILSYTDIQIILSPVGLILELHRVFEADLQVRLQQWGPEQCVGDVFVKFCSRLRVYSNYLNNYTTALCTVDKCRENKPSFRAFLKRADRTLATHMFSLQELLLCPVWRIQEYATLLQALSVHTNPDHPDQPRLCSALSTLLRFKEFIQKVHTESGAMQLHYGDPLSWEGNRQLIISQDAALLQSPDEQIPDCLRTYEQVCDVGLFLFNDALVLTRRNLHHTPFRPAHRCTHTFLASVDLGSLDVSPCSSADVSNAFVLQGPCRSWVCATESGEEKQHFLSVLRSAMKSALRGHQ
uniref:Coiled-coil domain containing 28A n=1 Tax=Amphiprion percula TaxID=161767 RepID=A0A3P8T6Z8_AMPPE